MFPVLTLTHKYREPENKCYKQSITFNLKERIIMEGTKMSQTMEQIE